MTIKILYVDDEIGEQAPRTAQKIRELLHIPGQFEVNLQHPPKDFSELSSNPPDALLVDLDLSTAYVDEEPISYFGSTLAAEMRMRHPSCPIILVTRPENSAGKMQLLEESADLDLLLLKDDIIMNPSETRIRVQALANGFKALDALSGQEWQKVLDLVGADDKERNLLREAGPPFLKGQWNVPNVARWLRNIVMGFPGILYDDLTAATRLGLSLEAFQTSAVQSQIAPARYTGVFSDYSEHWWRDRLFVIAQRLMLKYNIHGLPSQGFGKALSAEFGEEFSQAICIVDGTAIADWVCYVLRKPVKQRHSIPYYPDSRPGVMDEARVSFTAIQTSRDFDETLVDADGYKIVERLWEGNEE